MNARPSGIVHRVGGFAASVLLTSVVSFLSIPLLVHAVGKTEWGHVALAQTVTQLASIFVLFGWGATGAATIAGTPVSERRDFYLESLRVRAVLWCIVYPIGVLVLWTMLRGDLLTAALGTLAYLMPALGGIWYFSGTAQPFRLLVFDTIPTVAGTIAGIVAATMTGEVWPFLVCQAAGSALAVVLDAIAIMRLTPKPPERAPRRPMVSVLSSQRHAVTTTATTAFYVTLPSVALSVFAPALLPTYLLADRMFKFASIAFLPIQQFFQGWVPEFRERLPQRVRAATVAGGAIAVLGGLCIAVLSPPLSPVIGAGEITVPLSLSVPFGAAFVGIGLAMVVGYAGLVAVGKTRVLALSTVAGAVVGAPLIVISAAAGSLELVAWSVAAAELTVAAVQTSVLIRTVNRMDRRDDAGGTASAAG